MMLQSYGYFSFSYFYDVTKTFRFTSCMFHKLYKTLHS